jgi:hypothetical protein
MVEYELFSFEQWNYQVKKCNESNSVEYIQCCIKINQYYKNLICIYYTLIVQNY